jgi:hypothetical protein
LWLQNRYENLIGGFGFFFFQFSAELAVVATSPVSSSA